MEVSEDNATDSRRKRIINEILTTEFTYVEFLKVLHESFYEPLLQSTKESTTPILPLEDLRVIFQNCGKIFEINSLLLKNIKRRISSESFSYESSLFTDVFLDILNNTPIQSEYQKYINNYEESLNCLIESRKYTKFQKYTEDTLKLFHSFPNLQSYLITPIQRLPRYILMLNDLNEHTPDDHADKKNLAEATAKILNITTQINSGKEFYEQMLRKEKLLKSFSRAGQASLDLNIRPQEIIITEAPLLTPGKGQRPLTRTVIITTNHIIVAKKKGHELKLCNCWSLLSCNVTIKDKAIRLQSLDRTDEAPFIKENTYYFNIPENESQEYWEKTLRDASARALDSAALLDRASCTRDHLQTVLMTPYHWEVMSIGADVLSYAFPGAELVKEGQLMEHIFYIQSGSVDVVKEIEGHKTVLVTMVEGDIVGDISFLKSFKLGKPAKSTASLTASSANTNLIKFSHEQLCGMLEEKVEIAWRFYFFLAAILGERVLRINNLLAQKGSYANDEKKQRRTSLVVGVNQQTIPQISLKDSSQRPKSLSLSPGRVPLKSPTSARAPTSETESLRSSHTDTKDKKYASIYKLIGETIITVFSCRFRMKQKKSSMHGSLLLSRNHICLYRKVFGKKTQIIVPGLAVEEVTYTETDPKTIHFKYMTAESSNTIVLTLNQEHAKEVANLLGKYGLKKSGSFTDYKRLPDSEDFDALESDLFQQETIFSKNDVIMEHGKLSNCMYQLTSGRCRVEIESRNGKRNIVGFVRRGETFGELSFLLGTVTGAFVIADTSNVAVVKCSWADLAIMTSENPGTAAGFYRHLSQILCKRFLAAEKTVTQSNNTSKSNRKCRSSK